MTTEERTKKLNRLKAERRAFKGSSITTMKAAHPISYKLEATQEDKKTVVYLYGDIVNSIPVNFWTGEPEEGDFITPKTVRDLFSGIKTKDVDLHINSYGGDVFASIAIMNYLNTLDKKITVFVDGIAASGASIIAMAGDTIKMYPTAVMMIHRAWTITVGNANDMRKTADTLTKLDSSIMNAYKNRYNGTGKELEDLLNAETWLTASEAKSIGLCDEVINGNQKDDKDSKSNNLDKSNQLITALINAAFNSVNTTARSNK